MLNSPLLPGTQEANRRDGADLSDKMSTSGEPLYASVASSACGRAASPFSDHDRYEAFVPAVYIEPKPVASPSTLSAASVSAEKKQNGRAFFLCQRKLCCLTASHSRL